MLCLCVTIKLLNMFPFLPVFCPMQALCPQFNYWHSGHWKFEKAHKVTILLIHWYKCFYAEKILPIRICIWVLSRQPLQGISGLSPYGYKSSWLCWAFGKSRCFWFYISCRGIKRFLLELLLVYVPHILIFSAPFT